jgi:hypothetical protein
MKKHCYKKEQTLIVVFLIVVLPPLPRTPCYGISLNIHHGKCQNSSDIQQQLQVYDCFPMFQNEMMTMMSMKTVH